jgi:hypothetical protein
MNTLCLHRYKHLLLEVRNGGVHLLRIWVRIHVEVSFRHKK